MLATQAHVYAADLGPIFVESAERLSRIGHRNDKVMQRVVQLGQQHYDLTVHQTIALLATLRRFKFSEAEACATSVAKRVELMTPAEACSALQALCRYSLREQIVVAAAAQAIEGGFQDPDFVRKNGPNALLALASLGFAEVDKPLLEGMVQSKEFVARRKEFSGPAHLAVCEAAALAKLDWVLVSPFFELLGATFPQLSLDGRRRMKKVCAVFSGQAAKSAASGEACEAMMQIWSPALPSFRVVDHDEVEEFLGETLFVRSGQLIRVTSHHDVFVDGGIKPQSSLVDEALSAVGKQVVVQASV
mmetsp:Transcript_94809/g.216973  ORF Transcript_94809/g.216973 Transcript_94809/m.216973 type:complete len:304 (+) Transcript_94809:508-1419(+)